MKLSVYFLFALMLSAPPAFCQEVGHLTGRPEREGNTFRFRAKHAQVLLDFCTEHLFRVRISWDGNFEQPEHFMVVKYDWAPFHLEMKENEDAFVFSSAQLNVAVKKVPFAIEVTDREGKLLSKDGSDSKRLAEGFSVSKALQAGEHFFGFGERMDFLDRRNKKVVLNVGRGKGTPHEVGAYNVLEANYAPVPFFMSTKGYGIFLHNSFATSWDMGASDPETYSFGAAAGELDYYFIYGPTFPDILGQYTALTGRSPLLAKFALGLHAGTYSGGTWGYEELTSDRYVIELARKFRELGIPVDLLWLDSTWRIFGKNGGKGATSFEWRSTFKDPKGMFDSLYAMNYQMVGLHLRPRFDNGEQLNLLDQAREKGLVYPEAGNKGEFVDFFDRKSVDWWWDNGVMKVAEMGAKFLKTDEGSAFGGLANESDKTGPTDKQAQKLHNVFPIAYAKAPYEKFQEYNGMRGLNHTREGYAGIQRYPFIFAGDWPSEWQYFEPVIKAGLNIGLSGVGFWGHCMGGFEHVADPELYIRWVQFGMFSPIAMVFGMEHPQYKEPWQYGEEALANFVKYDRLRYRLIPYLYSLSYEQYGTGIPMMRALAMHYQDDANVYGIADQYLLGERLMVCPVTTKGAKTRTVYLPAGKWYDYWTGQKYEGRQYIHVTTALDKLPIFAKEGAILPMQQDMDYVGARVLDYLSLDIFPGREGGFDLYEDDGRTLDYQQGKYALTSISMQGGQNSFTLNIKQTGNSFQAPEYRYKAKIRYAENGHPKKVFENGKELRQVPAGTDGQGSWSFDAKENVLYVQTASTNKENIAVVVNN